MISQISTVFAQILEYFGWFVEELTTAEGSLNGLLPLLFIGVAVSIVLVAVKVVRKIMWGN